MQPVTLSLHPSRRLALMLLAAHGGTFAAIVDIPAINLVLSVRLVLLTLIALSLWLQLAKLYGRQRIVSLRLHADGKLEYVRRNNETETAEIHPHTMATPLLTVLLLGRRRLLEALVVLPDALDGEDFRQLRLWLRWQVVIGESNAQQ